MTEDIEVDGGVKVHTVDEAAKARSMCRSASRRSSMFSLGISGSPTRHVFVGRMGFFCVERVLHEGDFKGFSFLWFLSLVFQIHWKLLGVQNKYQTSRISMVFGSLVCFFLQTKKNKKGTDWFSAWLPGRSKHDRVRHWCLQGHFVKPGSVLQDLHVTGIVHLYHYQHLPPKLFKCRKMAAMTMDPLWVVGFFNLPVFFEAVDFSVQMDRWWGFEMRSVTTNWHFFASKNLGTTRPKACRFVYTIGSFCVWSWTCWKCDIYKFLYNICVPHLKCKTLQRLDMHFTFHGICNIIVHTHIFFVSTLFSHASKWRRTTATNALHMLASWFMSFTKESKDLL